MTSRSRFLALALAAALLAAGCLSAAPAADTAPDERVVANAAFLAAAKFAVLPGVSEFLDSQDGTLLHARIFRPDTSAYLPEAAANFTAETLPAPEEWRSPIIMVMSPYFDRESRQNPDDPASMPLYERYAWLITHFVPKGYTVILQDVRGTGESAGCLEQTGPKQMLDQYITIEHYATQPWANGRVGMFGKSYDGETQQSSLVMTPPHLTTIIPLSSVAGQYEWNFYDGVPYTVNGLAGMVSYAQIGLTPGNSDKGAENYLTRPGCHPENLKEGADPSGTMNRFWLDREFRLLRGEARNTSVFYVHGLADWNVKPNHIRDWFNDLDVPKTAWLGQWGHDYPEENRVNPDWSRADWRDAVEKWYDYWLLGIPTGADQWVGTVQVQDSTGQWRNETSWPPHEATATTWHLADGKLHTEPANGSPSTFREDARSAMPLPDPLSIANPGESGVTFMGEPLAETLHYAGTPWLNFSASLDRPDVHFAVHLLDVAPDGTMEIVNRGYLSAPHREDLKAPTSLTPGEVYAFSIRLFPQDDMIPAGHALGVRIDAVDDWVQPAGTGATVTVLHDADHPATLTLPLVTPTPDQRFQPPSPE